jgi:hypothetical protein
MEIMMSKMTAFVAREHELLDEDFDGFGSAEEWDAYDEFEAQAALPARPFDPELEAIIGRLEARWRSEI